MPNEKKHLTNADFYRSFNIIRAGYFLNVTGDISAEELFNMFFGGAFQPGG